LAEFCVQRGDLVIVQQPRIGQEELELERFVVSQDLLPNGKRTKGILVKRATCALSIGTPSPAIYQAYVERIQRRASLTAAISK